MEYPVLPKNTVRQCPMPELEPQLLNPEVSALTMKPQENEQEEDEDVDEHEDKDRISSVILRPWVLVQSGARTRDLPHGSPTLYQLS